MELSKMWHFGKFGLKTFLTSIHFFYSHVSLLLISLIPSLLRAYQMWNEQTPIWLEVMVELTRVILILQMVRLMSKSSFQELRKRTFWNRLVESCSTQMKQNWPGGFIAHIIVFIVLLFGVGNLLINLLVNESVTLVMAMLGFESYAYTAAYDAYVFFLKNMSVIPLAMVYVLNMCGIRRVHNSSI